MKYSPKQWVCQGVSHCCQKFEYRPGSENRLTALAQPAILVTGAGLKKGMEDGMEKFITRPLSSASILWRLAAALCIGGLVGFYTSVSSPGTLDVVLSAAALLLPALLHVALDKHIRSSVAGLVWSIGGALLLGGLFFLIAGPGKAPGGAVFVMCWLAPISASFTVGNQRQRVRRKWRLSVLCGMLAWLGVGIHNLLLAALIGGFLADPIGRLVLALLIVLFLFGILASVLTGQLGAGLHAWLRRRDRDEHIW